MVAVDLRSLIAKLDNPCRRALEAATGLTRSHDAVARSGRAKLSRSHYSNGGFLDCFWLVS
jgi:hypothetical protein